MFVPSHFRPEEPGWVVELVRAFPMAILVSSVRGRTFATHLPTVLEFDASDNGDAPAGGLVGTTIFGHMNRRNPHYAALAEATEGLLIFNGPNGYVSPAVYDMTPAAPTWNFAVAHVRGALTPLRHDDETRRVVRSTAMIFERRFGKGWDMASSLGYFDQLLPGVGAFRMTVTEADGLFKLSQDQPAGLRGRVTDAFGSDDRGAHRQLAELMRRHAPSATGACPVTR